MAGAGYLRFILKTPSGYACQGGKFSEDPNEACFINIFGAGGRFAGAKRVIESLCSSTGYEGDPSECSYQTFDVGAEDGRDYELGYSVPVRFVVTAKHLGGECFYPSETP